MKNWNHEKREALRAADDAQNTAIGLLTKTQTAFAGLARQREGCKMSTYRVSAVARELDDLCRLMVAEEVEVVNN